MNNNNLLAEKIADERKKKGLTQDQLAEKAGVNIRTIQRIEAGKVKPQLNTLCQLSQIFEIKIEELTDLDKKEEQKSQEVTTAKSPARSSKAELMILHLTPLGLFFFPAFGNIIAPVLMWLWKRNSNEALNRQGKRLINFQISLILYILLFGFLSVIILLLIGNDNYGGQVLYFVSYLSLIALTYFGVIIRNVYRVSKGKEDVYPFMISFLKENNSRLPETGLAV